MNISRKNSLNLIALFVFVSAYKILASSECIPNEIIVKLKTPSTIPILEDPYATQRSNKSIKKLVSQEFTYTAINPYSSDLILIKGEKVENFLESLNNNPNVEYAEPHYIKKLHNISFQRKDLPNDPKFYLQWGLENQTNRFDINYLEGSSLSKRNIDENPVIIAIIDSKFSINHTDLKDQLWINEEEIPNNGIDDDLNGYVDDIHGYDFVNLSPDVIGEDIHGTHVAGISIAKNKNNNGISGVFPEAKFIALACGIGIDELSSVAINRAKNYIANLKLRGYNIVVVNASYGGNIFSQNEYDGIKELSDLGVLFCTASGNEGINLEIEDDLNSNGILDSGEDINGNGLLDVSYPNNYDIPNIISVSAINSNGELAYFANYGKTKVDIAAPGEMIYSTINLATENVNEKIKLDNDQEISFQYIEYSGSIPDNGINGQIVECGLGNPNEFSNLVTNNIALIQRGVLTFENKVANAMNAGAVAVIIYNNSNNENNVSRNWTLSNQNNSTWIPSISISQIDGNYIKSQLPTFATIYPETQIINEENSYGYLSGTSMATPMVSGAIAFAAYNFPDETMLERKNRILDNVTKLNNLEDKILSGGILNLSKIIDTDEDGLPDWWENEFIGNISQNSLNDPDNDSYNNVQEYLSNTNPIDPNESPMFKNLINLENINFENINNLQFEFMAHYNFDYIIESSFSLNGPWVQETTYLGDNQKILTFIDNTNQGSKRFYRLKALFNEL